MGGKSLRKGRRKEHVESECKSDEQDALFVPNKIIEEVY